MDLTFLRNCVDVLIIIIHYIIGIFPKSFWAADYQIVVCGLKAPFFLIVPITCVHLGRHFNFFFDLKILLGSGERIRAKSSVAIICFCFKNGRLFSV